MRTLDVSYKPLLNGFEFSLSSRENSSVRMLSFHPFHHLGHKSH